MTNLLRSIIWGLIEGDFYIHYLLWEVNGFYPELPITDRIWIAENIAKYLSGKGALEFRLEENTVKDEVDFSQAFIEGWWKEPDEDELKNMVLVDLKSDFEKVLTHKEENWDRLFFDFSSTTELNGVTNLDKNITSGTKNENSS